VFRAADFCQAGQSQHGQRLVRFRGGHANSATGHTAYWLSEPVCCRLVACASPPIVLAL
jgi:hypothetical protein